MVLSTQACVTDVATAASPDSSSLAAGNRALREQRYTDAMGWYLDALQGTSRLGRLLADNLALVRQRRFADQPPTPTLLIGQAEDANRVRALAAHYTALGGGADIVACGRDHPCWHALADAGAALHRCDTGAAQHALERAVRLVVAHPYDTVHLVAAEPPQLLFGVLYKLLWGAQVLLDRRDDGGDVAGAAPTQGLPSTAAAYAALFDGVTVASPALQLLHGGQLRRPWCSRQSANQLQKTRAANRQARGLQAATRVIVATDFRSPQAVIETALALAASPGQDIVLALVGYFDAEHASLRTNLRQIDGLRCLFLDADREYRQAWSLADAFLLPDRRMARQAECLAYAFACGVPVFASRQPGLEDLFARGALIALEPADQAEMLLRAWDRPALLTAATDAGRRLHASDFAQPAPAPLPDRAARPPSADHAELLRQLAGAQQGTLLDKLLLLAASGASVSVPEDHELAGRLASERIAGLLMLIGMEGGHADALARELGTAAPTVFLEALFQAALGRPAQAHEARHFAHLLDSGSERVELVRLLFESEESAHPRRPAAGANAIATAAVVPLPAPSPAATAPQQAPCDHDDIAFPVCATPLVSIIIPVYGKLDYTEMCLRAIQRHLPAVSFEIIVVDDCSPDDSAVRLSRIRGVRLVRNRNNLGFIRACNHGASHARGRYLCFLNNDTEVQAGWLEALMRTFDELPGTGLVGSKLVYPDGRLQEAGGIIWQDGSAWNFGRLQDPQLPEFNYAREVDYCSGASIVLLKSLFDELGGFDEHYLPAYCEDADLALKVRERGLRVIYQPLSTVVHHEGVTSGTDTGQGVKAYQVSNLLKMAERWRERLSQHQPNGQQVDRAKDRMARHRVLVIDHCTPTPNRDAGSIVTYNLLLVLREMGFQPTFIAEDNFLYMPEYTTALQRQGVELVYSPYVTSVQQHLDQVGDRYDLVLLFRPGVVDRHLATIRRCCPRAKVLFHTVDLHFLRMQREAALLNDQQRMMEADAMRQREYAALRAVDASIVLSTAELDLLRPDFELEKIHIYPLALDIRGTEVPYAARRDIVFVGSFQHQPNVDAVHYFVSEVMPLLRLSVPGIRLVVVGSNPPPAISALASDDITIAGFVDQLAPLLDRMRVAVAPLRYGAGVKGKIATAMALGLPNVATTLAIEGMGLHDGVDVLTADTPADMVRAIARLYHDHAYWHAIQQQALDSALRLWGPPAAWGFLEPILEDLGFESVPRRYPLALYR